MMRAVEFSSVFEFIRNGMNIKQGDDDKGLPITRIETISNGIIDPERVGYAGLMETEHDRWLLKPNDILFSHINSYQHVGKCALYKGIPQKLIHGMNLLCFRPDLSKIHPQYMICLLRTDYFRKMIEPFINKAVNQASISVGNLKSLCIEIPSIDNQKHIAAILDQADHLRRLRTLAIEMADKFPQALFEKFFGEAQASVNRWPEVTLADVVKCGDQINYGVVQPGAEAISGVPLVRVANLVANDFCTESLKKIAPSIEAQYKRSRLHGDEILIACVGSIGAIALASPELAGANIARAVARIRVDGNKADRAYVAEFLKLDRTQRYFRAETRAVAQPTLNIKQLSETPILLPPVTIQREFSSRVRKVAMYRSMLVSHLSKLDSLFASLQHRAFSGELTSGTSTITTHRKAG